MESSHINAGDVYPKPKKYIGKIMVNDLTIMYKMAHIFPISE